MKSCTVSSGNITSGRRDRSTHASSPVRAITVEVPVHENLSYKHILVSYLILRLPYYSWSDVLTPRFLSKRTIYVTWIFPWRPVLADYRVICFRLHPDGSYVSSSPFTDLCKHLRILRYRLPDLCATRSASALAFGMCTVGTLSLDIESIEDLRFHTL